MLVVAINLLAAIIALLVILRAVCQGGARFWVNLYALGVVAWGILVFMCVLDGFLDYADLPTLMRPVWALIYTYLIVSFVTERRHK